MEMKTTGGSIEFSKVLSDLDKLVLKFIGILDKENLRYVIISGYVPILFGRSRATEDVDIFIEKMGMAKFLSLASALKKSGFYCLNHTEDKEAFSMLSDNLGIRFAEDGKVIPNFEIKFPKKALDSEALENPVNVFLSGRRLMISSIESQIPYKIYLGSDRDIEDAVYLFEVFRGRIDAAKLRRYALRIGVLERMEQYGIKV